MKTISSRQGHSWRSISRGIELVRLNHPGRIRTKNGRSKRQRPLEDSERTSWKTRPLELSAENDWEVIKHTWEISKASRQKYTYLPPCQPVGHGITEMLGHGEQITILMKKVPWPRIEQHLPKSGWTNYLDVTSSRCTALHSSWDSHNVTLFPMLFSQPLVPGPLC